MRTQLGQHVLRPGRANEASGLLVAASLDGVNFRNIGPRPAPVYLPAGATDGGQIVVLYNLPAQTAPSPVIELNRAMAVAMHQGPAVGLEWIDALPARGDLADYHLAHSVRAERCCLEQRLAARPPA